jgi:chromosome segregation ATPase
MKKWLPNLLLVWSLILCALIAVQWFREAKLRGELQAQHEAVVKGGEKFKELEGKHKLLENEIKRLDGVKVELTEQSQKNSQEVVALRRSLAEAEQKGERAEKQSEVYKKALEQANASIERQNKEMERQNEDVKKQNEAIKQANAAILQQNQTIEAMGKERNEIVERYNKLVKEYEDVVKRLEEATADPKAKKKE